MGYTKKWILILITLFILTGCGAAKGLLKPEFTLLKAQEDVNAVKGEIDDLSAEIDANANAVAGMNNKVEELSAGRDIVTTTTNDPIIIKGLIGLCATLISILGWCLRTLIKRTKQKKFYKEKTLLSAHNDKDLNILRTEHDKFVRGGNGKFKIERSEKE